MKVLNVDKFSTKYKIVIDGKEYTIKAMSVKQFSELDITRKLNADDEGSLVEAMIEILKTVSDIPEDVLWNQEFKVLTILLGIAQGQNPEDEVVEEEEKN